MSVPLHQRRSDKSIRLSPQGELGREMSLYGKPQASHNILPDVPLSSHHGQTLKSPKQSSFAGATSSQTNFHATADTPKSQSWGTADHAIPILVTPVNPVSQMHTLSADVKGICCEARIFPEEILQEKAILTIKEFYRSVFTITIFTVLANMRFYLYALVCIIILLALLLGKGCWLFV
jgi:translation initiation factor 4G